MKTPRNTPLFLVEEEFKTILGLNDEQISLVLEAVEPCGGITDKDKKFRPLYPTPEIRKVIKND